MIVAGGCHCGAVRYTIAVETKPAVYACHCRTCQTWSGSAFSEQFVVAEDAITVGGPVVIYEFISPSGSISRQRMCGTCHVRIFNTNSGRPGRAVVRAGTLDDSDTLTPLAHIWVRRKQPCVVIPDSVPAWPESAPPAEMAAALESGR
jgi:hypothetical protein